LGTDVGPLRDWPLRTRGNNADKNRGSAEKNRDYSEKLGYEGKIIDMIERLLCISGDGPMYFNSVSGSTEKVTLKTVTGQPLAEHLFDGRVCYSHTRTSGRHGR
jgi:hypothetical protein